MDRPIVQPRHACRAKHRRMTVYCWAGVALSRAIERSSQPRTAVEAALAASTIAGSLSKSRKRYCWNCASLGMTAPGIGDSGPILYFRVCFPPSRNALRNSKSSEWLPPVIHRRTMSGSLSAVRFTQRRKYDAYRLGKNYVQRRKWHAQPSVQPWLPSSPPKSFSTFITGFEMPVNRPYDNFRIGRNPPRIAKCSPIM